MAVLNQTLRDLRLDKKLTQEDVAERLGISQATYSAIERGMNNRAVPDAMRLISRMKTRTDRTSGGDEKVGRRLE